MIFLKYLLLIAGIGLFGSAAALVLYDVYLANWNGSCAAPLRPARRRVPVDRRVFAGITRSVGTQQAN
jgi:hypothetical protein